MAKKKNNRKRTTGWAKTKSYPHERHPATYRRKGVGSDDIEYITFTHSDEVDLDNKKVRTVPMLDNVSPAERRKNKEQGKKLHPIMLVSNKNRRVTVPVVLVKIRRANYLKNR